MKLPLRHPPPPTIAQEAQRCLYLEELAEAAVGLPLGHAASQLMHARGRGRHGNALQWHLGLQKSDSLAQLDWEDRIEIKLVSVWRRPFDRLGCDKLKVCDANVDPWRKLSNVLWVCADRMTRVVQGCHLTHLQDCGWDALRRSWQQDPHFEQPDLFIESRETSRIKDGAARGGLSRPSMAPAYYVSARWVSEHVLTRLPSARTFLQWDGASWQQWRKREWPPCYLIVEAGREAPRCPACGEELVGQEGARPERGWIELLHPRGACPEFRERTVVGVDGSYIPKSPVLSREEQAQALSGAAAGTELIRLVDRCLEPEDHLH